MGLSLKKGAHYWDVDFLVFWPYFPLFKLLLSHIHMCPWDCSKYFLFPVVKPRLLVHSCIFCPLFLFLLNQSAVWLWFTLSPLQRPVLFWESCGFCFFFNQQCSISELYAPVPDFQLQPKVTPSLPVGRCGSAGGRSGPAARLGAGSPLLGVLQTADHTQHQAQLPPSPFADTLSLEPKRCFFPLPLGK